MNLFRFLFPPAVAVSVAGGVLFAQGVDPHDPETERASFRVAPGFEVNLFASERDGVIKPIQIRFDPDGRLWVVGSTVYPQIHPGQPAEDVGIQIPGKNALYHVRRSCQAAGRS